ncbi:A24 family peptidase [Sphingomicrobium nitratireducens]|uniref:A24 family peptidase n=1 Tax=Sphingomicrobium nitratireducens TaxID=2964666 RepID=UPI00223FCDE9|nr:prepilin peptidase [Sphingomicrobium nitratireducens]
MINGIFTEILVGLFALLMVYAAVRDVQTYLIRNRLSLAVALLAPLYWWSSGLPLWPDAAIQAGIAAGLFALLAVAFRFGVMGGGDVKLATAAALWFSPMGTARFLVVMSIAGGIVTLVAALNHKIRGKEGNPKIPYGVAIAIGALWNVAQRFLNHFA